MHSSRSHDAVIRVYGDAGNVVETRQHKGDFKEPYTIWSALARLRLLSSLIANSGRATLATDDGAELDAA